MTGLNGKFGHKLRSEVALVKNERLQNCIVHHEIVVAGELPSLHVLLGRAFSVRNDKRDDVRFHAGLAQAACELIDRTLQPRRAHRVDEEHVNCV